MDFFVRMLPEVGAVLEGVNGTLDEVEYEEDGGIGWKGGYTIGVIVLAFIVMFRDWVSDT